MVELAAPHARFHRSFLRAADEFIAAGEPAHAGILVWPADEHFPGVRFTREGLESLDEFQRLVDLRLAEALPECPRPTGWVPCTHLWMADGDEYLGAVSLRHSLDHPVLRRGGHIGYSVRPSARRRGHATDALRQTVALAGRLGLDRVLVTCDLDNVASARAIEAGGGVFADTLEGKRRYWIATTDRPRAPGLA